MRFGLLALILAGCESTVVDGSPQNNPPDDGVDNTPPAQGSDFLENQSRVEGDHIQGGALAIDGHKLVLGVYGATCAFRATTGAMEEDQDVEDGDDDVDDGGDDDEDGNGVVALVAGPESIKLVNIEEYATIASWFVEGHVTSRIDGDSVISIAQQGGGCVAQWHTVGSPTARNVDIAAGACTAGFVDVDPNGTAWISTGDALVGVTGNSVSNVPAGGDVTVWDDLSQAFYGFDNGGTMVSAWEADGTPRWATEMGGTVYGLDDMNGNAVVSFHGVDGAEIALLDGQTGEQQADQAVHGNPGTLQFRGGVLAHIQPRSVDLFRPVN